jgi:glutamate racemase
MKPYTFDNRAIGIFDSGVGGLTVAAAVQKLLSSELIYYFGDLLHLPYGSKSGTAVLEFTRAAVRFLMGQNIKLLVIACNTATSIALDAIERELSIPVVGVIEPGAKAALRVTRNRNIGVIGTRRTIESGAYRKALEAGGRTCTVHEKATPLLVPLIEEGWSAHPVLRLVLREYLGFFRETPIDTVVLGCTHYPLIREGIEEELPGVKVVDSARSTAEAVKCVLEDRAMTAAGPSVGVGRIFLTDYTDVFMRIGETIFGKELSGVELIRLDYREGSVVYHAAR